MEAAPPNIMSDVFSDGKSIGELSHPQHVKSPSLKVINKLSRLLYTQRDPGYNSWWQFKDFPTHWFAAMSFGSLQVVIISLALKIPKNTRLDFIP